MPAKIASTVSIAIRVAAVECAHQVPARFPVAG